MKNKAFKQLYKLLKTGKSHSGFTLLELLAGVIMSSIVVSGLGYGLYQLTRTTKDEAAKIAAREGNTRGSDFISSEIRRSLRIEVDNSDTNLGTVAPSYTLPTGAVPSNEAALALEMPGVTQRIIYSVAPPKAGTLWKGPLVLYRWGPNMDQYGEYTDPEDASGWQNKALMEGLDNISFLTADTCNGSPFEFTGFAACIEDDDGDDDPLEDGLHDTNGDGEINLIDDDGIDNDSIDDVDGFSRTATLYFASDIKLTNEAPSKPNRHVTKTQAVARVRTRDTDQEVPPEGSPSSAQSLLASYSLGGMAGIPINPNNLENNKAWSMRTDFRSDTYHKTWIHSPDRQGQQLKEFTAADELTISFMPICYNQCTNTDDILSRGNLTYDEATLTHELVSGDWVPLAGVESSDFTIDFDDPATFNGNETDDPTVPGVEHVRIYRKGSEITSVAGYDDDTEDLLPGEQSLAEFLVAKKYAIEYTTGQYRLVTEADYALDNSLIVLGDDERLIAVEVGQALKGPELPPAGSGIPNPGYDFNDGVIVLSSDVFDSENE